MLNQNRIFLRELSGFCSCGLEIEARRVMSKIASKHGGVAKFSGAGGGDCGIGVCFDKNISKKIQNEWRKNNISVIPVSLSAQGIKIEN